jgi:hypothetical protein
MSFGTRKRSVDEEEIKKRVKESHLMEVKLSEQLETPCADIPKYTKKKVIKAEVRRRRLYVSEGLNEHITQNPAPSVESAILQIFPSSFISSK